MGRKWLAIFRRRSSADGTEDENPTEKVLNYIKGELQELDGLRNGETEEIQLKYHNASIELVAKETNKSSSLNGLLAELEADKAAEPLTKSEVLKSFCELLLVLKNASEQDDKREETERKNLQEEYNKLFERCESLRNALEYEAARGMGYEGTLESFVTQLTSH